MIWQLSLTAITRADAANGNQYFVHSFAEGPAQQQVSSFAHRNAVNDLSTAC